MENREAALTKEMVAGAPFPESGDYTIRDSKQPGLGLRVSPGSKAWIVRRKLRGKSFRHVLGRFPEMTLDQARREAKKAVGQFEEGRHPTLEREARKKATNAEWLASRFTVADMWAEYRGQRRDAKPFSAHSLRDFAAMERRMAADPLWSAPFFSLTGDEIRKVFARQTATPGPRSSNGGKTTANHYFRMLRTAAQFAIKSGRAPAGPNAFSSALENNWHRNNARKRTLVADKTSLRRWWEAVDALRASASGDKRRRSAALLADFQVLVLLWGGRKAETLSLRWEDVDFGGGTVRFAEEATKNRTEHKFPLCAHAELVLRRLQALQAEWGWSSPYVFPATQAGRKTKARTHIKEPKKAMLLVAEAAGVPFTAHDIRRTFSNLLASASEVGAEQAFVKMAMNHAASDDVTATHYLDKVAQLRPIYERLERVVLEKVGVVAPRKIEVDAEAYARFQAFEAARDFPPSSAPQ